MSIGSGLSGSFGWSKQTTDYATRVAPAKFIRHRGCDFQPVFNRVQGEGIQSGALGLRGDQLVPRDGIFELQLTEELREVTYLDRARLDALLAHPYFALKPPKSLDRDAFSVAPVANLSASLTASL